MVIILVMVGLNLTPLIFLTQLSSSDAPFDVLFQRKLFAPLAPAGTHHDHYDEHDWRRNGGQQEIQNFADLVLILFFVLLCDQSTVAQVLIELIANEILGNFCHFADNRLLTLQKSAPIASLRRS